MVLRLLFPVVGLSASGPPFLHGAPTSAESQLKERQGPSPLTPFAYIVSQDLLWYC